MQWLLARLKEPSTHAGIGMLLMAAAQFFPAYSTVILSIGTAFGFTAVVKKDGV